MIDHDSEPQTEMGVFLSKACRSVWNSVFDRLIDLILPITIRLLKVNKISRFLLTRCNLKFHLVTVEL